jgi:hypothetical protein
MKHMFDCRRCCIRQYRESSNEGKLKGQHLRRDELDPTGALIFLIILAVQPRIKITCNRKGSCHSGTLDKHMNMVEAAKIGSCLRMKWGDKGRIFRARRDDNYCHGLEQSGMTVRSMFLANIAGQKLVSFRLVLSRACGKKSVFTE